MALDIKIVEYYNITVDGNAGEGYKLLSVFADVGINLLAFKAVPVEPMRTRFSLFPDDSSKMNDGAKKAGLNLDGPHFALIVKGYDDESGECANIHEKLSKAGNLATAVNMYFKYGFRVIPKNDFHNNRANIKMEMILKQ